MLQSGQSDILQRHLQEITHALFTRLHELRNSSDASRSILKIPSACPSSPIFSVQLAQPKELAKFLQDEGMMVRAVVPPTVPQGSDRVRICLHAGNTLLEVEKLVRALGSWCEQKASETQGAKDKEEKMSARL